MRNNSRYNTSAEFQGCNKIAFREERRKRKKAVISRVRKMTTKAEILRAMQKMETNDLRDMFMDHLCYLPISETNKIDRLYMGTQSFLDSIREKQLLTIIMPYLSIEVHLKYFILKKTHALFYNITKHIKSK